MILDIEGVQKHPLYESLVSSVDRQIRQLRVVLESAEAKEREREYVLNFMFG